MQVFVEMHISLETTEVYDAMSRPLLFAEVGKSVYMEKTPGGNWGPARVIAQSEAPLSYIVETEDGSVIR